MIQYSLCIINGNYINRHFLEDMQSFHNRHKYAISIVLAAATCAAVYFLLFVVLSHTNNAIRQIQSNTSYQESVNKAGLWKNSPHLITPNVSKCDTDVFLLCVVYTALSHSYERGLIRTTWANVTEHEGIKIKTFFILGTQYNNSEFIQLSIDEESKKHHDILQFDFLDTYYNLSNKMLSAIKWKRKNCPNIQYILKVDDDVFVNVPALVNIFHRPIDFKGFYCSVSPRSKVQRKGKYAVTYEEYANEYYPPYCTGPAYLLSNEWLDVLYEESLYSKPYPLDDVFFTGLIAEKVGIPHTAFKEGVYSQYNQKKIKSEPLTFDVLEKMEEKERSKIWLLYWNKTNPNLTKRI